MKLTRKQRVVAFLVLLPLLPVGIVLAFMSRFSYFLSQILEKFSIACERFDRMFLAKKYEKFIQSIK